MAVAEDAVGARKAADLGHEVVGETGLGLGEVVPVPGHRDAGKLPVAGGRVLALADLGRRAPDTLWHCLEPRRFVIRRESDRCAQAQGVEVGQVQRPAAPVFRPAFGRLAGDVAEGVGARIGRVAVEEPVGIRRAADPGAALKKLFFSGDPL